MEKLYITIKQLSERTGIPKPCLLELVEQQKIPCLSSRGRLLFNFKAVQSALDQLAGTGVPNESC